jgi:hypothetical protein
MVLWQGPTTKVGHRRKPHQLPNTAFIYMKASTKLKSHQEPVGIVISQGARIEPTPTLFAYVWGPAPEISEEPREAKVA